MKGAPRSSGGSGTSRLGRTPTADASPAMNAPFGTAPAHQETGHVPSAGGQGALDELHIDPGTSEERWRSLLDNPIFGITFLSKDMRYDGTNRTFQKMVGYSAEELRRITPLDISVPGERELNALYFKELKSGERTHYEMIKQLRRKDQKLIWTHLYVFAVTDSASGERLPFGIVFDITDRKQAQDSLEQARAELVRVARANQMGAMTGSIAHEISQPLSSMVTAANAALSWLARPNPDIEEAKVLLQGIVHDGRRASDIIKGIRTLFKADTGNRSTVNLNVLIREVLALARSELRNSLIDVRIELDEKLPTLTADPVQLQQVIFNLITNAVDAMDQVEGRDRTLTIKSERRRAHSIAVSVVDTGTGIVPENMDKIFKSFFTTKADGMGMGLAICQSILETHGGRLDVRSGHPHGAIFEVSLPVAPDVL
jgi:PAS domain S-box-containing protein